MWLVRIGVVVRVVWLALQSAVWMVHSKVAQMAALRDMRKVVLTAAL